MTSIEHKPARKSLWAKHKIFETNSIILVIGVLNNGLNLLHVNSFWQYVAKGIVILLAVMVDVLRKREKAKKNLNPKQAAKA